MLSCFQHIKLLVSNLSPTLSNFFIIHRIEVLTAVRASNVSFQLIGTNMLATHTCAYRNKITINQIP